MDDDSKPPSRAVLNRRKRADRFVEAAQHIISEEGFEGLTMSRLAVQLDTVVSAVYRYFPSKGALIAEIQRRGVKRMVASLDLGAERIDRAIERSGLDAPQASVTRLVMFGRWFCATSQTYPEELRLFQLIMSQRGSVLDPDGGARIQPVAMQLLGRGMAELEAAQRCGALSPGDPFARVVIWCSAISGVIQTDDLVQYLPKEFGDTRLAQQANLTLLAGWGAPEVALAEATRVIDLLAEDGPLAARPEAISS